MKIGIIGTGKLGLCKALCLDAEGYDVYCYDINLSYLEAIKNKTLQSNETSVQDMLSKSNLKISNNEEEILQACEVIFVYIQTPSTSAGNYDHSYIDNFVDKCIQFGKQPIKKIIAISSTVMPEYTDSVYNKLNEYNYDICYNPTFIAQGSIIANLINPNLILIGGSNRESLDTIEAIHKTIVKNDTTFHKMTPLEAEITKISINCFITTKISFANMVGDLLMSKDINPEKVLDAVGADCRIGNRYLKYGFGFGGPCFPRDNKALNYYADSQGFNFQLCKSTDDLNKSHLLFQFNSLKDSNKPIEFTYITYKDNSDILEESQKLKLAVMLAEHGCKVIINERYYIIEKLKQQYGNVFEYIII